jgi:hypothetical protein
MASDSTTFAAEVQPPWASWALPSVGDLFFVALFCLLIFTNLSWRLLGDAGIGWHIRAGQLMLSTHQIPHVDPFSSSLKGHPWFAWEWLYDVIVGWLDRAAGLNGVVVFTALVIALTFSLAFRWLVHRGTNAGLALILVLLAASASMIHFLARPHVVSWLLTFVWFWILDSWEEKYVAGSHDSAARKPKNSNRDLLWLLPVAMVLWVNLHGGFLIGFVLLAIYWSSAAWQWIRAGEDRFNSLLLKISASQSLRRLGLIGVLSFAATGLNPYGFSLYRHIYKYLSNRFLMNHIDEFQSPNFHYVAQKCFAGLLMLTLVALATRSVERNKIRPSHGMILLFAVYSGLYASRNIPVSSLLLILVIGPRLSNPLAQAAQSRKLAADRQTSKQFLQRMQSVELSLRGHLWPLAAVLFTGWVLIHGGQLGTNSLIRAQFNPQRFPVAAVNTIEKQNLPNPLFAPDYWGGYLIYRLYPKAQVVIDDRHDFYGESFLRSYLKTMHVEPGWQDFLQEHPAHCLIVPKDSAIANILAETASWRTIYEDKVAVIFVPQT